MAHQTTAPVISMASNVPQMHTDDNNSSAAGMLSQIEAPTVSEIQAPSQTGQEGEGGAALEEVVEGQASMMVDHLDSQSRGHCLEVASNHVEAEMLAMVNEIVDEEEE